MNRSAVRAEPAAPATHRRRPPLCPTPHGSIFASVALSEVGETLSAGLSLQAAAGSRGRQEQAAKAGSRGRQQGQARAGRRGRQDKQALGQGSRGRQWGQAAQSSPGIAPHGQAMATGPRCPLAALVGPSLLPSQLGGGFRPHIPRSTEGQRSPDAAPSPLLPATGTQNPPNPLPPPLHQSPLAQARADSSVTTRPSPAPSLPTTQLPLQQETALVNQCSSPLICVCQVARRGGTQDCESPSITLPVVELPMVELVARWTAAGTGQQCGEQEMWPELERFGDPWSWWDA